MPDFHQGLQPSLYLSSRPVTCKGGSTTPPSSIPQAPHTQCVSPSLPLQRMASPSQASRTPRSPPPSSSNQDTPVRSASITAHLDRAPLQRTAQTSPPGSRHPSLPLNPLHLPSHQRPLRRPRAPSLGKQTASRRLTASHKQRDLLHSSHFAQGGPGRSAHTRQGCPQPTLFLPDPRTN